MKRPKADVKHIRARNRRVARLVTVGLLGAALAMFGFIGTVGAGPPPPEETTATTDEPTAEPQQASDCNPNYTPCVPNDTVDVDCLGGSGDGPSFVEGQVQVIGEDVYDLDADENGVGCEIISTGGGAAPPPPTPVRAPVRFTG
jgi:hypothetical protein